MKQGLLASYIAGIKDRNHGVSYYRIMRYFLPEFITSFVIFALPFWIDANFISHLKSTPTYGAQGITNNLLHLFFKLAEAFSIGTVILVGQWNGLQEFKKAGKVLRDAFWITIFSGAIIASLLYFGAHLIFYWLNASPAIMGHGIPFLRLRAIGIFFTFVYLAFIGFLRGIKNTRTTMYIFIVGALVFIFFDYSLIFGAYGLPPLGLDGSAFASIVQSIVMSLVAAAFVAYDPRYRPYGIELLSIFKERAYVKELLTLIWPVAIDKATLALAYIWLNKMINPMGTSTSAAFCVIKDLERFAFLPAIAFAQIITFLVSNDYGTQNWAGIKSNIKKIMFLASLMVFSILTLFSLFSVHLLKIFDKNGDFTELTVRIFPFLSVLVFFDLVQIILSGALRGAGDVKVVMMTRLVICFGYFIPVSYFLSGITITDPAMKFLLVYGSFYVGNALMSVVYIHRFRGHKWKEKTI